MESKELVVCKIKRGNEKGWKYITRIVATTVSATTESATTTTTVATTTPTKVTLLVLHKHS